MSEIITMLQHFKQRPQMYICRPQDSMSTSIYLDGYLSGLSQYLNRNLHAEVRLWYMQKNRITDCSLVWCAMIEDRNKGVSDEELKSLYVDTLIDFFTDNHILKVDNNISKR